jgi:ribosomal protein S3
MSEAKPKKPRLEAVRRLRLTTTEAAAWTAEAKRQGLTLSNWLRVKVGYAEQTSIEPQAEKPQIIIHTADPALVRELAKIGGNLNQLVKALNTCAKVGTPVQVIEVTALLLAIQSDLSAVLPQLPQSPSLTRKSVKTQHKAKTEG